MAEFQIITKADLENLNISKTVQGEILNGVNIERMNLDDLIQITNNLTNLLNLVMKENIQKNNRMSYSYSYNKIRKNTFKQITLIGALLVFRIRQFLLQESITFSLGATDDKGQLFERQITQDELFERIGQQRLKLRSSLSSHAIMLSKSLERYNNEDFKQVGELNLWPSILQLAFGGPREKNNGNDIDTRPKFYQKDSADENVYVRYSEGKRQILQYYYDRNKLIYFNRGWLYEWYMEYLSENPENEIELSKHILKHSLAPLFEGRRIDSVEGYKGGDYISATGQQMQAKYFNQQMITFTSIITVLKEMQNIFTIWKNGYDIEKASESFAKLFTDDATVIEKLNTTYSNIINQQLLSLLQKK